MQYCHIFIYYLVLNLKYIVFSGIGVSALPGSKSGKNNGESKSLLSVSTIKSKTTDITNALSGGISLTGIVLDFDATQVSSDIQVGKSVPGILKYSATTGKKINKIKGNGKSIDFSKKVDHVFCNSPFDNNVTVVFEDSSTEEFVLGTDGFKSATGGSAGQAQVTSTPISQEQLELDLGSPSNKFTSIQVNKVKCLKPKTEGEIISTLKIDGEDRAIESNVKENFICYIEENGNYSILVAYLSEENRWLKYTLSKMKNCSILLDVSLMRNFDDIQLNTIFLEKSSPYDSQVFEYKDLKINKNDKGVLKSETKGNIKFILTITDPSGNKKDINFTFATNFILEHGFKFHSIRSKEEFKQVMFTYVNDNVVLHEKYEKVNDVYLKDLTAINKYDLKRTKTIIGKENINNENVLLYTTLVPDSLEQNISISHHGRFKVLDFKPSSRDTFVIFPNMEFFLDKLENHKLILCENGENINIVMKTMSNTLRSDFIASTDITKGNPFIIKALLQETFGSTHHQTSGRSASQPSGLSSSSHLSTPSGKAYQIDDSKGVSSGPVRSVGHRGASRSTRSGGSETEEDS